MLRSHADAGSSGVMRAGLLKVSKEMTRTTVSYLGRSQYRIRLEYYAKFIFTPLHSSFLLGRFVVFVRSYSMDCGQIKEALALLPGGGNQWGMMRIGYSISSIERMKNRRTVVSVFE